MSKLQTLTIVLALMFINTNAQADVTRKVKTTSQFMGVSESTAISWYSADWMANDATVRWTAGLMKTVSGGKDVVSTTITRLDKELVWTLNPDKKSYTEMTFAEFREQLKKGMTEAEESGAKDEEAGQGEEAKEEMYEWKTEVKSDPNPQVINGWNCRNVKLIATGINKQEPNDKVWITIDSWNSADVPGSQEILSFQERYLKALGLDVKALTPGLMQAAIMFQKQFDAVTAEAQKAPGEPVRSLTEIKRNQLAGPSVKEGVKDAAGQLTGKLPFGMKKQSEPQAPQWQEKIKFRSASELMEAATGAVDAAKFEIPAGYKLKKK